jgi:hypothetical protein
MPPTDTLSTVHIPAEPRNLHMRANGRGHGGILRHQVLVNRIVLPKDAAISVCVCRYCGRGISADVPTPCKRRCRTGAIPRWSLCACAKGVRDRKRSGGPDARSDISGGVVWHRPGSMAIAKRRGAAGRRSRAISFGSEVGLRQPSRPALRAISSASSSTRRWSASHANMKRAPPPMNV